MKQDNDSGRIDRFIEKSLRFRQDEAFHTIEVFERYEEQLSLAASGGQTGRNGVKRIGLLANKEETVLLRVFREQQSGDYWLFPLSGLDLDLNGCIVSDEKTLQFFHIREENNIRIPASAELNPLKASLQLTYPDDRVEFSPPELAEQSSEIYYSAEGREISVDFTENTESGKAIEITPKEGSVAPGKVLFRQGDFARMVPVYHGTAVVLLPEFLSQAVQLFLYE